MIGRLASVRTYLILLVALLTMVGLNAQQNVAANSGFESPGLPDQVNLMYLTNGSTFIPGWTVIDDEVGQPSFYGNTELNDAVLNGEYGVVLNQGSGMRTTFRAEPGAFYEVGMWIRPDDCLSCDSPAALRVTISGDVYFVPPVSGWSYRTVEFVPTRSLNTLELFNPSSPRDFKRYAIDDVTIRKIPGALLSARLEPVVTVEGTIGAKYQIQSANSLDAPAWTTLTNLVLSNSPTFFLDLSKSTNRFRVYRAVRVQ